MDNKKLKQLNQITTETVETLTEPIQPQYLLLTLEQYNKVAQYFSAVGSSIAEITDLMSYLTTHRDMEGTLKTTIRPALIRIQQLATDKADSTRYSVEDKLSKQTESLNKLLDTRLCQFRDELQARDLTLWRLKLKWASIGAILPLMGCILQLILQ